jgi:hypothetical protein
VSGALSSRAVAAGVEKSSSSGVLLSSHAGDAEHAFNQNGLLFNQNFNQLV